MRLESGPLRGRQRAKDVDASLFVQSAVLIRPTGQIARSHVAVVGRVPRKGSTAPAFERMAAGLAGSVRHVVLRRNQQQDLRAFVGPQLAVIGAGVGVEEIAGTETTA